MLSIYKEDLLGKRFRKGPLYYKYLERESKELKMTLSGCHFCQMFSILRSLAVNFKVVMLYNDLNVKLNMKCFYVSIPLR